MQTSMVVDSEWEGGPAISFETGRDGRESSGSI